MMTGHDTDSDTILGPESNADDYVTKPFRFAVLLARIRAQLRQYEASEDATSAGQAAVVGRAFFRCTCRWLARRPCRSQISGPSGPSSRRSDMTH